MGDPQALQLPSAIKFKQLEQSEHGAMFARFSLLQQFNTNEASETTGYHSSLQENMVNFHTDSTNPMGETYVCDLLSPWWVASARIEAPAPRLHSHQEGLKTATGVAMPSAAGAALQRRGLGGAPPKNRAPSSGSTTLHRRGKHEACTRIATSTTYPMPGVRQLHQQYAEVAYPPVREVGGVALAVSTPGWGCQATKLSPLFLYPVFLENVGMPSFIQNL